MKFFKIACIILTGTLLFTGCINSRDSQQNSGDVSQPRSSSDASSIEQNNIADAVTYINSGEEFSDKIQLTYVSDFNYDFDETIIQLLNEKLDEDGYSFAVNFVFIDAYKYAPIDFYTTAVENGEAVDILNTSVGMSAEIIATLDNYIGGPHENSYWECVDNGYLIPLNDYLASDNGTALYNCFEQKYWDKATDNDGNIYGLYTSYASDAPSSIDFYPEVAEEFGYDIDSFNGDIFSLEEVLKQIYDETGEAGLSYTDIKDNMCEFIGFSQLYCGIYINETTGLAENIFENEDFISLSETFSRWQEEGYMDDLDDQLENDKVLCEISNYTALFKTDSIQKIAANAYQTNSYLNGGMGITSTSQHPDEAFTLLSLLFSDPEYAEIICCGQEGRNYQINDEGVYELSPEYPPFLERHEYMAVPANPFIAPVVASENGEDYPDKLEKFTNMYQYVERSAVYGKELDLSEMTEELEQIKSIYDQYGGLFFGEYSDVEATIEEANGRLEQAGITDVIEEINRQLEAYYEENS